MYLPSDIEDNVPDMSDEKIDQKELSLFDEFFDDLYDDFFTSSELEISDSGLIIVCGYASFKLKTKYKCEECMTQFLSEDDSENEYFKEINRGGLTVPTDLCLELGKLAHRTLKMLISEKYESRFIQCSNQKRIMIHFLEESLFLLDINQDEKCVLCDTPFLKYFREVFKTFSNILLNNYSKIRNNVQEAIKKSVSTSSTKAKKPEQRKLSTLKK